MIRTTLAMVSLFTGLLAITPPTSAAQAGLSCMEPSILDSNPNPSFSALPGVYASPSPESRKIGIATSIVYAVIPLKRVGGFIEVLHPNGMTGWVEESAVEPWHNVNTPSARCTARILPNGKPHAAYAS